MVEKRERTPGFKFQGSGLRVEGLGFRVAPDSHAHRRSLARILLCPSLFFLAILVSPGFFGSKVDKFMPVNQAVDLRIVGHAA